MRGVEQAETLDRRIVEFLGADAAVEICVGCDNRLGQVEIAETASASSRLAHATAGMLASTGAATRAVTAGAAKATAAHSTTMATATHATTHASAPHTPAMVAAMA